MLVKVLEKIMISKNYDDSIAVDLVGSSLDISNNIGRTSIFSFLCSLSTYC